MVSRTKESLAECLEQYLLLVANNSTRKQPPANYKGVNCSALLQMDPQRIVIPILHCPMGLVDKVLETFKAWVNLEVEDIKDAGDEEVRSDFRVAKAEHAIAIRTLKEAKDTAEARLETATT